MIKYTEINCNIYTNLPDILVCKTNLLWGLLVYLTGKTDYQLTVHSVHVYLTGKTIQIVSY